MDIGILGWWRASNQGDFAIRDQLERALAPHRVVPIDLPLNLTPDELDRLNLLDFLILGGGGLFQDTPPIPFDTFEDWGHRLTTPLGVLGVGVDAVTPAHRPAVQAVVEQARFFYVRDPDSWALIGHPKVRVMPDLSFLYPFPRVVRAAPLPPRPICGVNLRRVPSLEVDKWAEALRRLPVQLRGIPLSTYGKWQEAQTLRQLDAACPAGFDPSLYQGLDLMVGMAFHSVVFSLQASIPTLAITYAPKVRRLFTDLGLEQWLLGLDEWGRLPELVQRALECRSQLAGQLQEIAARQTQAAQATLASVRQEIEQAARPRPRPGRRISIIVAGSESNADNELTLAACQTQTHENLETIFVGGDGQMLPSSTSPSPGRFKAVMVDPTENLAYRLNRALAEADGEYISWVAAGGYYAPDAISCMAAHLERKPSCDMVFADYYTLHAVDYIADAHRVDSAYKLFRGNVVGPCFLFRRQLSQGVGALRSDTPGAAYDFWLRARPRFDMQPLHARLFFSQISQRELRDPQVEREVRRRWRSTQSWLTRLFWRLADTDFADRCVIRPCMSILRKASIFFVTAGQGGRK